MKKLENALEVAEHTDAMLAFWDKDLVCRFANASYLKWFGLSPSDMIDKMTLPELLGPLYQQNFPYINKALQGKLQIFERDITLPNGETKNTIATYTPKIKQGIVTGFYAHVADITPVRNESLKITAEAEDFFAMSVSHNYLNGVENLLRSSIFTKFPGIPALANQFFISPTKLKTDFKARYQCTIFSFYRSLQMQVADKYIKGKVYSKNQLAEMFGFDNVSNFSSCYRKYILQNPSPQSAEPTKEEVIAKGSTGNWEEAYKKLADQLVLLQQYNRHLHIGTWERNFETSLTVWDEVSKGILELPVDFEPDMTPAFNFYKIGPDRELAKKSLQEAFTLGKSFDFTAVIITALGNEKKIRVLGFALFENRVCKKIYGIFQELC